MSSTHVILILAILAGTTYPAVVLPRPPSSPNFIPQEYVPGLESKGYNEKAMYQRTNVEKPDTQDYRFLEIDLRDADTMDSVDLHGLVQAVLDTNQRPLLSRRRLDDDIPDEEEHNQTYPHPEVVPHSILGVRDVGLGPNQRLFEPTLDSNRGSFLIGSSQATKNFGDEKLYYLKSSRPKVYVNFRGRTGNFRQDASDSKITMRFEPAAFLRPTPPYHTEKRTKSPKYPPKKYDPLIHRPSSYPRTTDYSTTSIATTTASTTENTMVTSSDLPKQIPAPPSKVPSRSPIAHTTPVQRFTEARRTDILPGYAFAEA